MWSQEKIGFVGIENRIIVALSRAQHGMVVIGNGEMLTRQSPLWNRVAVQLNARGCYGSSLPLNDRCAVHCRAATLSLSGAHVGAMAKRASR